MSSILIKNAMIVSMDDATGDFDCGDILIEGDLISAIGVGISNNDAKIIDAQGSIVIPGLVNAHTHTWQTSLRGASSNWTTLEYF